MTSLGAAKRLLVERKLRPVLLLHPRALPEFADLDQANPNAVVVGLWGDAYCYTNTNVALRTLEDKPEAELFFINKVRVLPSAGYGYCHWGHDWGFHIL
jgi:hypothetical protein